MGDFFSWPQKVPDLTQDVSLKRARVDISRDTSAIRVAGTVVPGDITPITEALGTTEDTTSNNTVIGLLKQEVAKEIPTTDLTSITDTLGTTSDTTSDNTVIGLLKQEVAKPAADLTALGTTTDLRTDDTVIGLLKRINSRF